MSACGTNTWKSPFGPRASPARERNTTLELILQRDEFSIRAFSKVRACEARQGKGRATRCNLDRDCDDFSFWQLHCRSLPAFVGLEAGGVLFESGIFRRDWVLISVKPQLDRFDGLLPRSRAARVFARTNAASHSEELQRQPEAGSRIVPLCWRLGSLLDWLDPRDLEAIKLEDWSHRLPG